MSATETRPQKNTPTEKHDMTELLEKAIGRLRQLPEKEQDRFAADMLERINEKQEAQGGELADVMAGLQDIAQGRVYPLDDACDEIIAEIKQAQK